MVGFQLNLLHKEEFQQSRQMSNFTMSSLNMYSLYLFSARRQFWKHLFIIDSNSVLWWTLQKVMFL